MEPRPPALEKALFSKSIPKLDGLRAVAALAVVVYHSNPQIPFLSAGFGVQTFFVLSGFLITWLLLGEHEKTGTVSLTKFYARRALRIFPAFYCYWLLVTALLLIRGRPVPWGQAASSFFYVCNYYQGLFAYPSSAYSHTWSLGIEEQFYLLWPAFFLYLSRRKPARRIPIVLAVISAIWALRLALKLSFGVPEYYIYTAFETRADSLLVGCAFAMALRNGHWAALWRFIGRHPAATLLTVAALGVSRALTETFRYAYRDTIGFGVEPVLVSLLIVQLIALGDHPLVSWLDSRPMKWLGAISYSTYLYQQVVLHPAQRAVASIGGGPLLQLIGAICAVTIVATASYLLVERPLLRFRARFRAT